MIRRPSPKLTLLVGPAGCGKTHTCVTSFEERLKTSPALLKDDLLFILPTAEHRARTIDLVLRQGLGGFFHRRITTFDRGLKEFLRLGGLDFATDASRRAILAGIIERNRLKYFDRTSRTRGFLELLARTIVELKENLVTPRDLPAKLEPLRSRFPEFEMKYDDLAQVYTQYEQELGKRNLVDMRDSLRLLEEGLKRGELDAPEIRHVWIDGFSDFSSLQLAFIEFLTRHSDEMTVTLTIDDDPYRRALFRVVSETQSALEDLGFRVQQLGRANYRSQKPALTHLAQNLFREGGAPTVRREPSVQMFEAAGLVGEVEMIAQEMKRLIRAHDYHYSDIAVIGRHVGSYESVIHSVFGKYRIPVEIHERIRLRTCPVARTLTSFLNIILNDWTREDLLNFLKSGFVRCDYELACELELRALQLGIYRDRTYWLTHFEPQVFKDIARFEDQFRTLASAEQFARWVRAVMSHFGLLEFPDSLDEKTRVDRASAKRIFGLLEEIKMKMGSSSDRRHDAQSAGNDRFPLQLLKELIALMDVDLFSVHHRDTNRVQVYNISLARQKEYKVVFLVGLLEKRFPIQVKEDPILSDMERRAMNERGEILKERLPRQTFERYLFYLAVTRASERLILTYPRFDLEGKEALPSFYVDEVKALFSDSICSKSQSVTDLLPLWDDIATKEDAERRVVSDMFRIPEGANARENEKISFALYNRFVTMPEFTAVFPRLLHSPKGALWDEAIKPFFASMDRVWSPTRIEEYAECPYRYFANHLLKLENQAEGVDLRQVGRMLHDVLEHLFTWLRDHKDKQIGFEEAKQFCLKKFHELWQKEPLTGDRWHRIQLKKKDMEEMLVGILDLELVRGKPPIQGLRPRHFEYRFGFDRERGDYLELGSLRFRGIIDRIDVDADEKFALVVDYKTGKTFERRALRNGTSIQLPIYLLAARMKLELEPLGAHLYSLSEGASTGFHHRENLSRVGAKTRKGISLAKREFDDLLLMTVTNVERNVRLMEQGEIPVRPRDCVPYCQYSSVCRIEKWRLEHIYHEIAEEDRVRSKCSDVESLKG